MARPQNKNAAAIEAEWHGTRMQVEIAAKYSLHRNQILKIWHAAQKAGRLPPGMRHAPAPLECAGDQCAVADRGIARGGYALHVPGFLIGDGERRIPAHDPLLAALRRAHGSDARRRTDTVRRPDDRLRGASAEHVANLMCERDRETGGVT